MIHYTDQGKGASIVLIHGYLETSEVWDSFARKLAASFRVIAVDLPGHGKSDLISETETMESMAGSIKELIEKLNLKKVFMTGHSLGGYVTLAFAELFQELLSGYCLFHSHPLADPPEAVEKREREMVLVRAGKKDLMYPENVSRMFATENLARFPEELQRLKEIASSIPGESIIAVLKGMIVRPSRLTLMESGRVPCLWILGAMDNYISCEYAQTQVKIPENSMLAILENSGHLGFIEEEELSLSIIKSFVERLHDCTTA